MTRDEIIRMAREARLGAVLTHNGGEERVWIEGADWHDELEAFASLVAEHEREQCAKVAENWVCDAADERPVAAAIRARGQQCAT